MSDDDSEERIKLMTLGNDRVGKTSFIIKYTDNIFQDVYLSTIGIDFKIKNITLKNTHYKLFFYDTAGQEKHKSMALNMIKKVNGIILMYDITDKSSFEVIPDWIESIQESKGSDFPLILLGNKLDKEDERKVSKEEGKNLADKYEIEFFETSNKNGTNINEAGLAIVNTILNKAKENSLVEQNRIDSPRPSKLSTKGKNSKQKNSKKCC